MRIGTLFLAAAPVLAGVNIELSKVLQNLNDLNDWMDRNGVERKLAGAPLSGELVQWQDKLKEALKSGASRQFVRDLQTEGRKMRLSQMMVYKTSNGRYDSGIDLMALSGYGCYGTPHDRRSEEWVGKGKPVDLIDQLNLKLMRCYKCLTKDNGETCTGDSPYRATTRKGSINCKDNEGTCERITCDCDKEFSSELNKIQAVYNSQYLIKNGFDRVAECVPQTQRNAAVGSDSKSSTSITSNNEEKTISDTQCCGYGINRMPFKLDRQICCDDGSVKPIGQC